MKLKEKIIREPVVPLLIIVSVVFILLNPNILAFKNLLNMVRQISTLVMVAVGMTMVVVSGGIDLSVGSQISLIGIIGAMSMVVWQVNPVITVIICLAAAALFGLINGLIITRFDIIPVISTLVTALIFRGLSYIFTGGFAIYPLPESFLLIGQGYFGIIPVPVIIMVVMISVGSFILNNTYYGKYFYAVGHSQDTARQAGLNINKVKILGYVISSLFTGVAGIVILSRINSGQPNSGSGIEFDVITALALGGVSLKGGRGSVSRVILGVICIYLIGNLLISLNLNDYYRNVIKGIILLLAIALYQVRKPGTSAGYSSI